MRRPNNLELYVGGVLAWVDAESCLKYFWKTQAIYAAILACVFAAISIAALIRVLKGIKWRSS